MTAATELALDAAREEIERLGQSLVKAQELRDETATVKVRCSGRYLDEMPEAPDGQFYLVLEIATSDEKAKALVEAAVKSWSISIGAAAEVTQ